VVDSLAVQEFADPRVSVQEDVAFLKENPLIHPDSKSRISGWYYSVRGRRLRAAEHLTDEPRLDCCSQVKDGKLERMC
jgi:carbonic anhydrase